MQECRDEDAGNDTSLTRLTEQAPAVLRALFHPVSRYQTRHPLKHPRIIRHQHDTGRNGVSGEAVTLAHKGRYHFQEYTVR
ncbi:hypothetical protein QB996_001267 [Salmonella enterica]|nr:hypothetical protein [Salmonella enterica]EKS5881076.1 hypothetical protein [Salmonella enterica]